MTEFQYWWQLLVVVARRLCSKIEDVGGKTAKTVINITKLSSTHFVSNIDVAEFDGLDNPVVFSTGSMIFNRVASINGPSNSASIIFSTVITSFTVSISWPSGKSVVALIPRPVSGKSAISMPSFLTLNDLSWHFSAKIVHLLLDSLFRLLPFLSLQVFSYTE